MNAAGDRAEDVAYESGKYMPFISPVVMKNGDSPMNVSVSSATMKRIGSLNAYLTSFLRKLQDPVCRVSTFGSAVFCFALPEVHLASCGRQDS